MATTLVAPSYSVTIPQNLLLEPLEGTQEIFRYLEIFPESIFTKSPETTLFKFIMAIMGPSGLGILAKQIYEFRQLSEEISLSSEALDEFFANPFSFPRNSSELYPNTNGPISNKLLEEVKSKNASFQARALNYVAGAYAGNTPLGIRKVAEAGLGYGAEIIENYKFLFDQHSDKPLGLPRYGKTLSTEEFVIVPAPEISTTPVIRVKTSSKTGEIGFGFGRAGQPQAVTETNWVTKEPKTLSYISVNSGREELREKLEEIPNIGKGNVSVSGGAGEWLINLEGNIDTTSISLLNVYSFEASTIYVEILYGVLESNQQTLNISSEDGFSVLNALENIKPVDSIPTFANNTGNYQRVFWNSVIATSEQSYARRFVTGTPQVTWPLGEQYWIKASIEKEAPMLYSDLQYGYQGWHNIQSIEASTTGSKPIEPLPIEGNLVEIYSAEESLANYPEPLWVTSSEPTNELSMYINGIYPIEYKSLPGTTPINYSNHFWVSSARESDEELIIDFGITKAVNYVTFDIVNAPIEINIFYNTFDSATEHNYIAVTPISPYSNVLTYSPYDIATSTVSLTFANSLKQMIFTRILRIVFTRLNGYNGQIEVSNMRIGRNIS